MTIGRRINRAQARIGVLLAALALLVRLIVPVGFMPMATAAGVPTLIICTGQGPMAMPMPAMPGMEARHAPADHGGEHDSDGSAHGCFLAAVGGALDMAAPPVPLPIPFIAAAAPIVLSLVTRPGLGLAAPPPPKTGPPSSR